MVKGKGRGVTVKRVEESDKHGVIGINECVSKGEKNLPQQPMRVTKWRELEAISDP